MFDRLIGKPLSFATDYLAKRGIDFTVTVDDSNPAKQDLIVVRIDGAYHLVAMGMRLDPTQNDG